VPAIAPKPIDASQLGLLDAAERDVERRYARALQRSLFPDENKSDTFYALGKEVLDGDFSRVSSALRRRILLSVVVIEVAKRLMIVLAGRPPTIGLSKVGQDPIGRRTRSAQGLGGYQQRPRLNWILGAKGTCSVGHLPE
jgi:hypothetical protein